MKTRAQIVFEKARIRIDRINLDREATVPDLFAQVKEVVVIASSSRGGSSIFTEILRHSPELLHFKGEINPFLALAGLGYPHSGRPDDLLTASDAAPHNAKKLARLEQEMALDVGTNGEIDLNDQRLLARFKDDLHWRLAVQWPEINLDRDFLFSEITATFNELHKEHAWSKGSFPDHQLFHILLLRNLRRRYKTINPYYYDLRPDLLKKYCPDATEDYNSPSCCIIEEPPFVPIVPRRYITRQMAQTMPLIFKTPSNVYRLPFLKKIFPKARLKILHLTRNPADSINGLVDGWRHYGFFSHNMFQKLNIPGYSDISPDCGKNWWKYDLPPGWQEWTERPLEYVCGYQWRAAHREILAYLEQNQTDCLRIKFEEVIGPTATRQKVFSQISSWLGITDREIIKAAISEDLPPVMATTTLPPRKRRWFKKAALIRPVLTDPGLGILATAKKLGYTLNEEIG
ncbi:MAG: sulfotransferase [Proteobacteria bacterium]|nr:sulfotransferase [Pseudomonadota bacterium]MBU1715991.1 sulfotransferase [Pseudomonadota bacterium]